MFDKEEFDIHSRIIKFIERNAGGEAGAINIFIGKVKKKGRKGKVKSLYLEAYKDAADIEIKRICEELRKKYDLVDIEIGHGIGEYGVGESMVYVAIASRSRKQMYKAMEDAIEMYKSRPPIFKKEIYLDGSSEWV